MLVIVFASCEKDDYTDHSQLTPTNPSIAIDLGTITAANDGVESAHTILLTMSETQIVDVAVHVFVTEGTATEDVDFSISDHRVIFPAGKTEASFDVSILTDDENEETETFTIQVGDDRTANASITPVTAEFTIMNSVSDDLVVGMSWASAVEVYDVNGDVIGAYGLADLILTVTDDSGNVIYGSDGGSAEEVVFINADNADGTYYVTAGFYAAMDLGDQGDVDLHLTFDYMQSGVFAESFEFLNYFPISTATSCGEGFRVMEIIKSGTSYTFADYVDPLADFLGAFGGTDGYETSFLYASEVVTTVCGTNLLINGLNHGWMVNFWGETVLESMDLEITLNSDNTISIADQYYMTTLYDGSEYPYNIINVSGTWAAGGVLHIEYELDQEGFLVGQWGFDNGYSANPYYVADITLGAKSMSIINKKVNSDEIKKNINR